MIRLGLRLTLAGGREAVVRLVLLVASVGLGVGLLLIAVAGVNAVNTQNGRYAWLSTGNAVTADSAAKTSVDPLWWLIRADRFDGQLIGRIDVAATGPTSSVPPGIGHLPGLGQYYASPALAALLHRTPADQLAGRYAGHLIGDGFTCQGNILVGRQVLEALGDLRHRHRDGKGRESERDTGEP